MLRPPQDDGDKVVVVGVTIKLTAIVIAIIYALAANHIEWYVLLGLAFAAMTGSFLADALGERIRQRRQRERSYDP